MEADRRSILSAVDREMGLTRREVVAISGLAGLGALLGTIGMQIGEARAQGVMYGDGDVKILNVALGLEHEAIAAYQAGAESKLLDKPILEVAVLFQSQHKQHRDALAATIQRAGGKPVDPKKAQADQGGVTFYGIHTFSDRILFVLDVSGSMDQASPPGPDGKPGDPRITIARKELAGAVHRHAIA